MATVVVPFRSTDPKRRLTAVAEADRVRLAHAMLSDVLAAAQPLGEVLVVASEARDLPEGVRHVPDPRHGQGAAVRAALDAAVAAGLPAPYLVVNADVPCVVPADLRALLAATPAGGMAFVEALDGTTNALSLSAPEMFAPLYGPDSAKRFRARARELGLEAGSAVVPNLADDIDTLADLERLQLCCGPRTQAVLEDIPAGAAP